MKDNIREKLALGFITNYDYTKHNVDFGDKETLKQAIKEDINHQYYNNLLRIETCAQLNYNCSISKIKSYLSFLIDQLVINANNETSFCDEDYVTFINIVEFLINEKHFTQKYKLAIHQFIKGKIEGLNDDKIDKILSSVKVDRWQDFNAEKLMNKIKQKTSNEINKKTERYNSAVAVNNVYREVILPENIDDKIEDFREELLLFLRIKKLNFYVSQDKVINYIINATNDQMKNLIKLLVVMQSNVVRNIERIINEEKRIYGDIVTPTIISKVTKENIEKNTKRLKYFKSNILQHPELVFDLLKEDIITFNSNIDSDFGRSYVHRTLKSNKIVRTRTEKLEKLGIDDIDDQLKLIFCPEIRNNMYDDKKVIAFYRNFLLYLNLGELCLYVDRAGNTPDFDSYDEFQEFIYDHMDDYDNPETYSEGIDSSPFMSNTNEGTIKGLSSKIKKIEKELKNSNLPIKDSQQEFAFTWWDKEFFKTCEKIKVKDIKTKNGKYEILIGRYTIDKYATHTIETRHYILFLKEVVEVNNFQTKGKEIERILYFLPDGRLDCAQQINRIDGIKDENGAFLKHRPMGVTKNDLTKIIVSKYHGHEYDENDVLFKKIDADGSPTDKSNLAHYEIDYALSPLLDNEDIDKYFDKLIHSKKEFSKLHGNIEDIENNEEETEFLD